MGLTNDQISRYSRHLIMPEVGVEGQQKLINSKVLCIGAGGLGSPLALYLAAAGVGNLGILDFDVVDFSNLQRQIIHLRFNPCRNWGNARMIQIYKIIYHREKLSIFGYFLI